MYRGETAATGRLLDFTHEHKAPIVTTCLLCRDNLRSAARSRGHAGPASISGPSSSRRPRSIESNPTGSNP